MGLRAKVVGGAATIALLYLLLLGFLQWNLQARDQCVTTLLLDTEFTKTLQRVELDSRKYVASGAALDAQDQARLEGRIRSRLKASWAYSRRIGEDSRVVGRLSAMFGRARDWIAARRAQSAGRLYVETMSRILLARLKSGRDLGNLADIERRRLLTEEIEGTGESIFRIAWLLALLSLAAAWLSAWRFADYLLGSLAWLRAGVAQAASRRGRAEPLPVESSDELGALVASFNEMARLLTESRARWVKSERRAAVEQLALGAAHAINNPLTAIIGYADLLMRGNLDEGVQRDLRRISEQARRCHRVVESLAAALGPAEPGGMVRINDLIRGLLARLKGELSREQIELVADLEDGLPEIAGDWAQIERAFGEILAQARAALRSRPSARIRVASARQGDSLRVTFADNGQRPRPARPRFFDPFFAALGAGNGRDLSLSEAYGAILAQGGEVTVERAQSEGTAVSIELPIRR